MLRGLGGRWLMDLLITRAHVLSRSQAWLSIYAIRLQSSSWRYVYLQTHAAEWCSAWRSPVKPSATKQAFLLTAKQLKPIASESSIFSERGGPLPWVLVFFNVLHLFAPSQRSCGGFPWRLCCNSRKNLIECKTSGETIIM